MPVRACVSASSRIVTPVFCQEGLCVREQTGRLNSSPAVDQLASSSHGSLRFGGLRERDEADQCELKFKSILFIYVNDHYRKVSKNMVEREAKE